MVRAWLPRIRLRIVLFAGVLAWGTLSMRAANQWVFQTTRGMWFNDIRDVSRRDVAIVPGSVFRNGRPNAQVEERLRLALRLYEAGLVGTVLVSGDEEGQGHEATGMRRWLVGHGVSASRVMVDPLGIRTLATMTRAAHLFGVRGAIVCTQSWAAPRALFLARGSGIDAIALVPQVPVRATNTGLFGTENLKIVLAFVERYILGRTSVASPSTPVIAMATPLR